jgi:hypothetical protein
MRKFIVVFLSSLLAFGFAQAQRSTLDKVAGYNMPTTWRRAAQPILILSALF